MDAAVLSSIGDLPSGAVQTGPAAGLHEASLPWLRGPDVRFASGMEVPV
jgi:hypothetical protein